MLNLNLIWIIHFSNQWKQLCICAFVKWSKCCTEHLVCTLKPWLTIFKQKHLLQHPHIFLLRMLERVKFRQHWVYFKQTDAAPCIATSLIGQVIHPLELAMCWAPKYKISPFPFKRILIGNYIMVHQRSALDGKWLWWWIGEFKSKGKQVNDRIDGDSITVGMIMKWREPRKQLMTQESLSASRCLMETNCIIVAIIVIWKHQ